MTEEEEDEDDQESAYQTILRPCVDGPMTHECKELIVSGRASLYASCLPIIDRILTPRMNRPGRKGLDKQRRKAELLHEWRTVKSDGDGFESANALAKISLRRSFSDLTDADFEAVTGPKPAGRLFKFFNDINSDRNSVGNPHDENDDDLNS